jgi:RNA polymerase sigma-70 factor (ECF subfamily)
MPFSAFGDVYRVYGPLVQRALRQLGVDPAQIDDAAQDVFLVLHRRLAEYDTGRSLTNWLWGIARGVASTYRRGARRRQRLHEALPQGPLPEPRSLDEHAARCQANAVLHDFLSSLDEDKCAVFVLAEIEGCTGPEIAERLAVNINTVYARLRSARQRFDAAVARHRPSRLQAAFGAIFAWPLGAKTAVASGACVLAAALVVPALPDASLAQAVRVEDEDDPIVILDDELPAPTHARAATRTRKVAAKDVDEDLIVIEDDEVEETPMKKTTLAALAISAAIASPATAKTPRAGDDWTVKDADEAAHKGTDGDVRIYEFDNDHVAGESLAPDGTVLMQPPLPTHKSLITIRGHFNPELIRLGEDV